VRLAWSARDNWVRLSPRAQTLLLSSSLCLVWLLSSASARCAPLGAAIEVERASGAEDCPSSAELTSNVEHILQRSLASDPNAGEALRVSVRFTASADEYSAQVRSLGAKPGERALKDRGRSCSALAEAVSVAIALLLDKELERRQPGPAKQPPTEPAKPVPNTSPSSAPALALRVSFEAGVAAGFVGASSPLLSEQVGVRLRHRWLFDAGFNAVLPGTTHFDEGEVRSTMLFASLRGCYTWGERLFVGPCALLGLGRLRGVGIGYPSVASQDLPWTAVGMGVVAEGPVWGRVFWGISASVWLPTRRSTFSVENLGIAWESSTLAGSVAARLGFRIW
jgi:hypothetical protein